MISDYNRTINFTRDDGILTLRASEFLRELVAQVNLSTVLTGVGSPEGNVTAGPTQRYMDSTGTTGSILYIKKTGSGNTGWILV